MTDMNEDRQAADRITSALQGHVQGEFPWMKTNVVTALVTKWHEDLNKGIYEQRPHMAATKARFSFFSLSAELRNEVYLLAVQPDPENQEDQKRYRWDAGKPVFVIQSEGCEKYGYDPDCETEWWSQPAITKVSRQIRKESLPIFYGNVVFRAYGAGISDGFDAAERRFRKLRPYLHWIKHVHVLHLDELEDDLKDGTISFLPSIAPSSIKVMVENRGGGAEIDSEIDSEIGSEIDSELVAGYTEL